MEPWVQQLLLQLLQLVFAWALVALVAGALLVAVFLACRYLLLWYFRVNEAVALLGEIRDALRAERGAAPAAHGSIPASETGGAGSAWPAAAATASTTA